ncbi:MAG: hypothetical protein WC943_16290 [Elusimicrobiota bacterium]|jgi:GNAT superfamily N-acetyltransferase
MHPPFHARTVSLKDAAPTAGVIQEYRFGRYCEDPDLPIEASRKVLAADIESALRDPASRHIQVFDAKGACAGDMIFRLSQWDTAHFGFNVAVINSILTAGTQGYEANDRATRSMLACFDAWCRENKAKCVFAKVPALDLPVLHGLEASGFQFIESWIWNKIDLRKISLQNDPYGKVTPCPLRKAVPSDRSFMLDYVPGAFASQRFHADPRIPEDKKDSLYRRWIETAFAEQIGDILVMDGETKPAGFMITPIADMSAAFGLKFAKWRLALLDPAQRGKGLGEKLFVSLFHHHKREGVDIIDSGLTLRNLPSLNLHNKLRFKVVSSIVNFHRWY